MPNNLYQSTQSNNIMSEFNRFQQNPMQYLAEKKVNIPQEYMGNPQQAYQYLLTSGQLQSNGINQLLQKARLFGFNI